MLLCMNSWMPGWSQQPTAKILKHLLTLWCISSSPSFPPPSPPNFFLPLPQLVGCTSLGSRTLSWWSARMRPLQEVWWQGMYVYRKRLVGLPVSAPRSWQVSLFRLWVLFQSFSSLPHSFHFSSPLSSSFPLLSSPFPLPFFSWCMCSSPPMTTTSHHQMFYQGAVHPLWFKPPTKGQDRGVSTAAAERLSPWAGTHQSLPHATGRYQEWSSPSLQVCRRWAILSNCSCLCILMNLLWQWYSQRVSRNPLHQKVQVTRVYKNLWQCCCWSHSPDLSHEWKVVIVLWSC